MCSGHQSFIFRTFPTTHIGCLGLYWGCGGGRQAVLSNSAPVPPHSLFLWKLKAAKAEAGWIRQGCSACSLLSSDDASLRCELKAAGSSTCLRPLKIEWKETSWHRMAVLWPSSSSWLAFESGHYNRWCQKAGAIYYISYDFKLSNSFNPARFGHERIGKSLLESWVTTFVPDWQPPLIFVQFISKLPLHAL